jgi:RHS repeat-associated protein
VQSSREAIVGRRWNKSEVRFLGRSLVLALVGGLIAATSWAQCNPSAQCCPSSVGSGSPACNSAVGNPVNLAYGTKHQVETDIAAQPGVLGLQLLRHYNSQDAVIGRDVSGLGPGWRWSLDERLTIAPDGSIVEYEDGTGLRRVMKRHAPGRYRTGYAPFLELNRETSAEGASFFQLRLDPQRTLRFNKQGWLIQIGMSSGEWMSLSRDSRGRLIEVQDPQQRKAKFRYTEGRVTQVELIDHTLEYRYQAQSQMLASVDYRFVGSAGVKAVARYHYDSEVSSALLTKISRGPQLDPSAGWLYDADRRVILASRYRGGEEIEQLKIGYASIFAKKQRSVSVEAPGYGSTQYLFEAGPQGPRLVEVRGAGCESCGAVNYRLRYDASDSVVERESLDAQGQITMMQRGVLDSFGRVREVLLSTHDAHGKREGFKTSVQYSYTPEGMLALISRPSVVRGQATSLKFSYNAYRQVEQVVQSGWSPGVESVQKPQPLSRELKISYLLVNGRSVPTSLEIKVPGHSPLTQPISWDQRADFPMQMPIAMARGSSASQLHVSLVRSPPQSSMPQAARPDGMDVWRAQFDVMGRPVQWVDEQAEVRVQAQWGEIGAITQFMPLQITAQAKHARREIDDFGRVVALQLPGLGWSTAQYDPLNRLIGTEDARGARQSIEYNQQGQLQAIKRSGAGAGEEVVTMEYTAQGQLSRAQARTSEGRSTHHYAYDGESRLISKSTELSYGGLPAIHFSLRFARNEAGEVAKQELEVRGQTISQVHYDYDDEGKVKAIHSVKGLGLLGSHWAARWGLREFLWGRPSDTHLTPLGNHVEAEKISLQAHDSAGLPRTLIRRNQRSELVWDSAGRLAKVQTNGGPSYRYLYDAQGRRVAKLEEQGGKVRVMAFSVYDGARQMAQLDAQGRVLNQQLYDGWQPVAQWKPSGSGWSALQALWHGTRAKRIERAANGQLLIESASSIHGPQYIGQETDPETGLNYHLSRYFDPSEQRFISPDPEGIADAFQAVDAQVILDPYQYAGGRPDLYFDPDGAAKLSYFAIDKVSEKPGASNTYQGFQLARWAFHVEGIKPTSDSSSTLGVKQNEYARNGTELLFDGQGKFLKTFDAFDSTQNPDGQSIRWDSGSSDNVLKSFKDFYKQTITFIKPFEIKDYDDAAATKLIWYLSTQQEQRGACRISAPGWLPPIRFAPGEADINVTKSVEPSLWAKDGNQANQQRILNCNPSTTMPVSYASDEERLRVMKYEAAAELQESPRPAAINRDCSADDGCQSTNPVVVNGHYYYASYGRTQFVGETFLRHIQHLSKSLSPETISRLRLDTPVGLVNGRTGSMLDLLKKAETKARDTGHAFVDYRKRFGEAKTIAQAKSNWQELTPKERSDFIATGLGETEFIDMLMFIPTSSAQTAAEAMHGFASAAARRTTSDDGSVSAKTWMNWIYGTVDEYGFISRTFLRDNLRTVLGTSTLVSQFVNTEKKGTTEHVQRQRVIEDNLATRIAILHNAGSVKLATDPAIRPAGSPVGYIDGFLFGYGRGDWRSLRCSEELKSQAGLQMKPLELERKL